MQSPKKKEPWRIVLFIFAAAFIILMWVKKNITVLDFTVLEGQSLPMMMTTAAVFLLKTAAFAALVLLIRWIVKKVGRK